MWQVTCDWRKLRSGGLHICTLHRIYLGDKMKELSVDNIKVNPEGVGCGLHHMALCGVE